MGEREEVNSAKFFFAVSCSLMIVALLELNLVSTCQARSSIIFSSRHNLPPEEIELDQETAQVINQYTNLLGYAVYNCFGWLTTRDNILAAVGGWGHDYAIVWYLGHGGRPGVFYCITDDTGGKVWDYEIYPRSASRKVHFVFMYSCHQGDEIGGWWWFWGYGMCRAWLHTTDLSTDGYKYPDGKGYVYISFEGKGPQLRIDDVGGIECDDTGKVFVQKFYEGLVECIEPRINLALQYAAYWTWIGYMFEQCPFYKGFTFDGHSGRMVIYGDGSHVLQHW